MGTRATRRGTGKTKKHDRNQAAGETEAIMRGVKRKAATPPDDMRSGPQGMDCNTKNPNDVREQHRNHGGGVRTRSRELLSCGEEIKILTAVNTEFYKSEPEY